MPYIITIVNYKRCYPGIDQITGFKTKNIVCVPLINRKKECLGTLQVLNKKSGDSMVMIMKMWLAFWKSLMKEPSKGMIT